MSKDGTVYTKEWVVELMLDLAGFTADRDLASFKIVEPSFGEGAFLIPLVKRLLKSAKNHGREISDLLNTIRAYEVSAAPFHVASESLSGCMKELGISEPDIQNCLSHWLIQSDYLLSSKENDVDLVVGNPPYVRSNDIPAYLKESYLKACKTMTPGADLFVGFIEHGLASLKAGGVLSFICADRWMHNTYGKKLRCFVTSEYSVDDIIVMHDVDAFDRDVSAYPAITNISNRQQAKVHYAKADSNFSWTDVSSYLNWRFGKASSASHCECSVIENWFTGTQLWPLAEPSKLRTIEMLERSFPTLEDSATGTKVGIGVATGRDSVFVVSDRNIVESDRVVPIVTSRQLNKGTVETKPMWLVNPWNENEDLIELESYPRMKSYLEENETELKGRQIARKGKPESWYRTIDKVHPGLDKRQKLLVQDMHARFEPHFDDSHYPHGNLYYITSDKWDLEVLGGLLMSSICESFIDAYGVKMRGGTLRFQAQYLRTIRVPLIDSISDTTKLELKQAFRSKNYDLADDAARVAFGLGA